MRYAAFLRGIMPTNAKMAHLVEAFEGAGFSDVETVLSSGNVVFDAPKAALPTLERKAARAMEKRLGRVFTPFIRSVETLNEMLGADPFAGFKVPPAAKRVVTFLQETPPSPPPLPVEQDGARVLCVRDREVYTAYVATPRGPVFMSLIERHFGKDVTTRTWGTIAKVAAR